MSSIRTMLRFIAVATLLTTVSIFSFGQSDAGSSSIEGTVRDSNGAIVQGANVTIRNRETGLERNVVTNANGQFSASVLPVGPYTVTVRSTGFTEASVGATLRVGERTPVEVTITPQGAAVTIDVTGSGDVIATDSETVSTTISSRLVSDLPVRGRNFSEFAQLTPGIVQEGDRSGLVISGQRSINSNVAIDGADFNDAVQGNQRGGNEAVFFFPQTAIREFQVVRSGATAEIGRTGAGFVNAVTKSGSNEVRGELFYFNRNKQLTSPDAFDQDLDNAQNQFGGSIGGPIKRDKAFFFIGAEQNFLRVPFFVKFDEIPGATVPASILALEGPQRGTNNPTALFGRVDVSLNTRNTLNLQTNYTRFDGENFNFENPRQNTAVEANYSRRNRSFGFKGGVVSVLTPRLINEFQAQIATDERVEEPNSRTGQAVIANFGTLGSDRARPRRYESVRYQVKDNLSYDVGRHKLKFGFDVNINDVTQQRESNTQPRFDFETRSAGGVLVATSIDNYVAGRPRRFRQSLASANPDDLIFRGTQKEVAFFITDKINVTKNLNINLGLRWEGQINPQPRNPNPAFIETTRIPNDLKQWQPRAGLAYDLGGRGETVIRLSAGIFAARTPATLFQRVTTNNGLTVSEIEIAETTACRNSAVVNLAGCRLRGPNALVTFPNGLTAIPAGFVVLPRVFGFDPNFKNPRSFQASATIEQKLTDTLVMTAGFTRNSTYNLQRRLDRNLFPPTVNAAGYAIFSSTRPRAGLAQLEINESSAHASYNAFTASLRRRFANRYQFEANYTLAENRDDDSNERNFSQQPTQNPFDLKAEAGPSKQDVRHNFNLSGLYDLGRGFTISAIMVTRSGFPYTAIVEDGSDINNDGNDANDRVAINGQVTGRYAFRQPNFFNLDLRLLKAFSFSETKRLDLSVEVFNVTRSANKGFGVDAISNFCTTSSALADPSNRFGVTCPTGFFPFIRAGEPTSAPSTARFGGPRQVQLGARFRF